jgi:hypothetical protein
MDQTAARSSTRRPVVFRDGLGRRCRVPDQSGIEKFEILLLRSELTVSEHFEPALRERVARLASFQCAAFSRLKSVERLRDQTSTLVLVSETTHGVRLCDLITVAERRGFGLDGSAAWYLVRRLVSAIATLHEEAADVAHGAIAAERIIITPDARVVVVEHALAGALKHVRLSHEQFWKELRVACPRAATVAPLDHRSDITQIGVVALSLLLGRALKDAEYPSQLSKLVASITTPFGAPVPEPLRTWLQRALQLKGRESFASAIEASALLDEALAKSHCTLEIADLVAFVARCQEPDEAVRPVSSTAEAPSEPAAASFDAPAKAVETDAPAKAVETLAPQAADTARKPQHAKETPGAAETPPAPAPPDVRPESSVPRIVVTPVASTSNSALQFPTEATADAKPLPAADSQEKKGTYEPGNHSPVGAPGLFGSSSSLDAPTAPAGKIWQRSAAAAVLLTVISGAGWAAASHYFDVSAEPGALAPLPSIATPPATRFASAVAPSVASSSGNEPAKGALLEPVPAPAATTTDPGAPGATTVTPAATQPMPGWLNVTASADLQVFENGALVGSSQGGRVALAPGTHQLEFVNEKLGYRGNRTVHVRSGETAAARVEFPNGTIALNATPWAEVLIDGRSAGETPIGNLSVSVGSHEVVFRHPELGEQRTVVNVTLTSPTRLSVDMRKR